MPALQALNVHSNAGQKPFRQTLPELQLLKLLLRRPPGQLRAKPSSPPTRKPSSPIFLFLLVKRGQGRARGKGKAGGVLEPQRVTVAKTWRTSMRPTQLLAMTTQPRSQVPLLLLAVARALAGPTRSQLQLTLTKMSNVKTTRIYSCANKIG
jgi:hypothetical protein